jgi:hypothetical protein
VNYGVYLAERQLSVYETFEGALDAYRKVALLSGAHVRSPHSDVDFDGFTEDERAALEAAHSEAHALNRSLGGK